MAEYGLIFALVALVVIGGLKILGGSAKYLGNDSSNHLKMTS